MKVIRYNALEKTTVLVGLTQEQWDEENKDVKVIVAEPTELELLKEKYAILQGAVDFIVMNP